MTNTTSLIGAIGRDGRSYTARRLYRGGDPTSMMAVLRRIWRDVFDGDTDRMPRRRLAQDWAELNPDSDGSMCGPDRVAGVGRMDWSEPDEEANEIHAVLAASGHAWAYLVDERDDTVAVFEASVHGRWLWHSRHPLQAAFDGLRCTPMPLAGDAATATHTGHLWRPARVSLDGLHTSWNAEICTGEHARGVIVARFDTDTLDEVVEVTDTFYRDRLPGSGLPSLRRDGRVLLARWFTGTPHEQLMRIFPDRRGRYVLGPHLWPWILCQQDTPGYNPASLRGGTPPILEWVSPAGFTAAHPDLTEHGLPLVCAALAVLHPGGPGVIAASDCVTGYVWLPAPSHALMLTPRSGQPDAGTVTLPRPLGGSWSSDPLVPVVGAAQIATVCRLIVAGHVRLAAALTHTPATPPAVTSDAEEQHHAQP